MSSERPLEAADNGAPVGTWVLLCLIAVAMTAAWLFLYFGIFLPRGSVG